MADVGCKNIVFSPHLNPDVSPDMNEEKLRSRYEEFVKEIPVDWGVKTALAAEYMIVKGFEDRVAEHANQLLTFNDGSILVEMSYFYRSKNLEQALFNLKMAGLKPILAHPERYIYMADCLQDFDEIVEGGTRLQLNYMSLTGAYGKGSMKILQHLLREKMYSFVATDLHTLSQLDFILNSKPEGWLLRRRWGKYFETILQN